MIDQNLFKFKNLLWQCVYHHNESTRVEGPFCPVEDCRFALELHDDPFENSRLTCPNCKKEIGIDDLGRLRHLAIEKYRAMLRVNIPVISYDLPPTDVKAKDKDKNYWVSVKLGQKNGKEFAVVYAGRNQSTQTDKEKVQFFVDLEDEELRHDAGNMPPGDLLAGVKIRFKNSVSERDYISDNGKKDR
jgi:hypothetical protein